jgi:Na+-driven multidrug efflux pump
MSHGRLRFPDAQESLMVSHAPITIRTALLFFAPLILTTELHQISHSMVNAFLARLGDPTTTLAAFSVAFAFNASVSSMMGVGVQAGLSFITDKRSVWRVARFYFAISMVLFIFIEVVALTPIGTWLFGEVIGASPEVTRLATASSAIMALWIFPNQVRNLCTALCMSRRRTMLISHATVVRLVSQALLLMVLPFMMEGALAGAASLVGCMTAETAYLLIAGRKIYAELPATGGEQPTNRRLWRFSWPLMITQSTENGINFVINLFLGRLANPDLALAAFGVVNALKGMVVSPLRNLIHTAQALVTSRADMRVMTSFVHRLTVGYVVLVGILFFTPLRDVILNGVMGLPEDLANYAKPGVQITLLAAIAWGYTSMFRGVLSAMRRTRIFAASAVLRLVAVVAVGSTSLIWPDLNGAVVGIGAISAAILAEGLLLGWAVKTYSALPGSLLSPRREGKAPP